MTPETGQSGNSADHSTQAPDPTDGLTDRRPVAGDVELLGAVGVADPAAEAGAVEGPRQLDNALARLVADVDPQLPGVAHEEPAGAGRGLLGRVHGVARLPADVVLLLHLQERTFKFYKFYNYNSNFYRI